MTSFTFSDVIYIILPLFAVLFLCCGVEEILKISLVGWLKSDFHNWFSLSLQFWKWPYQMGMKRAMLKKRDNEGRKIVEATCKLGPRYSIN